MLLKQACQYCSRNAGIVLDMPVWQLQFCQQANQYRSSNIVIAAGRAVPQL